MKTTHIPYTKKNQARAPMMLEWHIYMGQRNWYHCFL